MKARKLFWLPAVMLMAACGNEEESSLVSSMPIQFSAEISASRVTGDSWEIGDRIGISMTGGGSEKANLPYVTVQTDGKFSAEGEEHSFPDVPEDVEFRAYYPYSEALDNNVLTFDVDGKTDVLWATKAVSADEQTAAAVSLEFGHVMSKVLVRTSGFNDDLSVALEGEIYNKGTLDITDGTVAGTEAEETTFRLMATTEAGEFSAIFVPEAEGVNKTLVLTSESEDREWKYELVSLKFEGGKQYIYDIDRSNAGIVFTNKIIPWISSDPDDLKNPIGGPIPLTIKRYLNGKTFKPDINYFFDRLGETGTNGYTNNGGNGFGNNVTENGQWTQDLKDKCESSSIKFYYGEDGQLMADAVNAGGTTKSGIIVTVDEKNKTLAFSSEPFDYHWAFTDKVSCGRDDCWLLLAQNEEPEYGSFTLNTAVNDIEKLFAGDKLHLAFWSMKDKTYYVVNFVMVED